MSVVEAWGVENAEGIYVMSEVDAREVASEDQRLVRKIDGEWVDAL